MARIRVAGHTLAELDELSDYAIQLVDTALHTVATKVAASLSATITAAGVDELQVILSLWNDEVDASLAPFIADTYESGALAVGFAAANGMNLSPGQGIPTVTSDHVRQHLAHAKNRLSGVGDDLWHRARTSLLEGHAKGESIDQLAVRVQAAAGLTAGRARTVARTEIISASNAGSLAQVHLIAGSTDQKEWLSTHDGRTREDHRHASGQVVDLHQPFSVGGWALQYPGDPSGPASETINCRCTLTYLLDETPTHTCACAGALTAAIEVKSESCLCPAAPVGHAHGAKPLPFITNTDKQAIYDSFKAQGSISPAYGGAKIYKHLQSMPGLEGLDLDEFQILQIVDEMYAKAGGKSSFAEKFDEWLASAAGKKATKGLEKPVISQVLKQAEVTAKPSHNVQVLSPEDIILKAQTAAADDIIAESGANLRIRVNDYGLARVEKLVDGKWQKGAFLFDANEIKLAHPDVTWHVPKANAGLEKPVVSQVLNQAETITKTLLTKDEQADISATFWSHMGLADPSDAAAVHLAVKKTAADFAEHIKLTDADVIQSLLTTEHHAGPTIKSAYEKANAGLGAPHVPKVDLPKPIVEKPPLPSEAAQQKDLTDISHVPFNVKADWFDKFKSVKPVTPGWGGSAINKTLQQAKELVKNDPAYAGLNDAQLLKMLDAQAKTLGKQGEKTYFGEVNNWAKTPAGKKTLEKQLAGVKATTPKVTPLKPSVEKPEAPSPLEHSGDISHVSDTTKNDFFTLFKSQGTYLTSTPGEIYSAIRKLKDAHPEKYGHLSDLQALRILDEVGAKKLGVADKHLYEKKITDWLKTPYGKKAALEAHMSPAEKAALAAKKLEEQKKELAEQQKMIAEIEKHYKVDTSKIPEFDQSLSSDAFHQMPVDSAQSMQNEMSKKYGAWKPTERAALKHYTGGSFSEMNNHLRKGTSASDTNRLAIANAQKGMRPSTRPILVHRGTGLSQLGIRSPEQAKQLVGKTMQDKGFMSTSVGGSAAFGGEVLMEIECPTGTPMAFVKSISHYKSENEMLLAAGLRYRVISVRQSQGVFSKTVVRVRVVP